MRTTAAAARQRGHNQHDDEHAHDHAPAFAWPAALRIGLVALAAAAVWGRVWEPFAAVSVLGVLGLAIGGWPIFKEAAAHIAQRRMTMELSMSLAIGAAAAIGEFFTALLMTLFVLVAEALEGMTVQRGRRAIRDVLDGLPRAVLVRRAGAVHRVGSDELAVGDAVLVNPGGRIPVDGMVIDGHSFVDQSRITGESMPVEKTAGAAVFAGSMNQSGALEIRSERLGRDTSYGKIIDAVEEAERSRAPVQRMADRLAGYLVSFALGAAALTFVITRDVRSTIAVVIVAGACGIAAGTPLAILGGIGRAARLGAIIKGGLYLELLGKVNTIVLDKTGTLTFGTPAVRAILPVAGVTADAVLDAATAAEWRSEHPLGKPIVAHAQASGRAIAEPEHFGSTPGRGIHATGGGERVLVGNQALMQAQGITVPVNLLAGHEGLSEVYVARGTPVLGAIAVADTIRPEAKQALDSIRSMGIKAILLTGDARTVADEVAHQLGISEVEADLLPEEKRTRVQALVHAGRMVAMLGDGINDAPALMEATVGVAMGSGTDVARESADIVLLGNDLATFVETLAIAQRTRRIIWQNFAGTLAVDALGVGLAACGLLGPLFAALLHVASELLFLLNAARLLPTRRAARMDGPAPAP
jgi:Cd2+/Zn2+-exporting ATPase/Cu+-exporting ATPase